MATPVISNIKLDKASYSPGQKAVLTFDASDPDSREVTVTISVTDQGGATGTATVPVTVNDPIDTTVQDSTGRRWTKTGQTGNTQTWEATV
jgi:hypothetical protein